jgi:hypothetical protein
MDDQRTDRDGGSSVTRERLKLSWRWFRSILIISTCFFAMIGLLLSLSAPSPNDAPPGYIEQVSVWGLVLGLVSGAFFGAMIGMVCGLAVALIQLAKSDLPTS